MIDKVIDLYKEKTKRECYKFEVEEGVTPEIMDDKIGGIPYLPVGEEYPLDQNGEPMILLVQINLSNVDLENYPKEGIIEIFIDKECSWPCDYKVKYFKDITEYRTDFDEVDSENYVYEKPLKIKLVKDIEHMPLNDYRFPSVISEAIKEATGIDTAGDLSKIEEFFEQNDFDIYDINDKINVFYGNLSGYADFTQFDPRNIEDKLECLIKIDSNIKHGFMIGDCGIIFSFLTEEDIKNGNFEKAVVDWDCC